MVRVSWTPAVCLPWQGRGLGPRLRPLQEQTSSFLAPTAAVSGTYHSARTGEQRPPHPLAEWVLCGAGAALSWRVWPLDLSAHYEVAAVEKVHLKEPRISSKTG